MWKERKEGWQKERPDEVLVEELHGPPMWKVRMLRWEKKDKKVQQEHVGEKTDKVEWKAPAAWGGVAPRVVGAHELGERGGR